MTQRPRSQQRGPGLGVLAARLLFAVQDELYARLEQAGHGEVTRPHGLVIAHLDEAGTGLSELARRAGRHKQIVGRVIDELEALGYVERQGVPGDRRAKIVVPTARGRALMCLSDEIIDDIERRQAQLLGAKAYQQFRQSLQAVVDSMTSVTRT
ncbi:MAG: MarR family winged helix-turn-helix transcriptional regulator [Micromonosporaceae bacterium]